MYKYDISQKTLHPKLQDNSFTVETKFSESKSFLPNRSQSIISKNTLS